MNRHIRRGWAVSDRAGPISTMLRPREDAMAAAERVAALLGLRLGERIRSGASGSLILKATRSDGTTVAVKVDHPARMCLAEHAALAAVGFTPPLLKQGVRADVAVTPWIEGARSERGAGLGTTEQVAALLGRLRLAIPPSDALGFDEVVWGLLRSTVGGDHRLGKTSPIDVEVMRSDSEQLLRAPHQSILLHGDLTTGNLVFSVDRAWAIDPRPHRGPLEWDAATWCLWAVPADALPQHVDLLSRIAALDRRLVASALRFQAAAFLTYRAEVGLDLPPDVLAMASYDLSADHEGLSR
ncbi:hypothetical protein [Nocardioides sp. NPDC127503]|uniref:hypothetical protein n=1 Tax=Nocardioides sp. NPDC127503 TaxID=3154516 RepID=UPI003329CA91